jgi:hypothetical protein
MKTTAAAALIMWLEYRVRQMVAIERLSLRDTSFGVDYSGSGYSTILGERGSNPLSPEVVLWERTAYIGVEIFLIRRLNHKNNVIFGFEG